MGGGFDPAVLADWEDLLVRAGDVARARTTEDQIVLAPLSCTGAFLGIPERATGRVERLARVALVPGRRLAEAIGHELDRGATGVLLALPAPERRDAIEVEPTEWSSILPAIGPVGTLHLRAETQQLAHARAWLEADLGGRAGGDLGLDPFGAATANGNFDDLADALAAAARLAAEAASHRLRPRAFALDSCAYARAGATTAQAMGSLIAALVASLRALEVAGVEPGRAARTIGLCLRIGPRSFEQIAALRALRLLHAQVLEACLVPEIAPLHLTAMTDPGTLSVRDPWVNLLRQTAVSFAGLLGGADAVGVLPFDERLQQGSELGQRIARNTTLILDEEAHLTRVQDPAAGSWFFDALTRDLAAAAWAFFGSIEGRGGLVSVLRSGWLLGEFDCAAAQRAGQIARREQARIGVTEFTNLAEELPSPPATVGTAGSGWPRRSLDDDFERLRAAADRHAARHDRPRVFLAGLPDAAGPRQAWLTQLVATAGIEAACSEPGADLAAGFAASGAKVAILTGSDAELAAAGPATARSLAAVGTVWAAGPDQPALQSAGVQRFVRRGMDMVDLLGALLDAQGVQR